MRTHDVDVDGIRLHVAEAGKGPSLVLLHGLSASHANWEPTIEAFADRFHVIAPDLPGHGRSAKPDAPYTIDFYAGVIRSLGRELGLTDAVVFGNSLGGQVALELALSSPAWTRALVLVAPAGGFGPLRVFSRVVAAAARPPLLRVTLPRSLERCFYDPTLDALEMRRRLLAERLADPDFSGFARAVSRSLGGALASGGQPLHRLTQPTLLVWGRDDRILPFWQSRWVRGGIPHAQFVPLDRCGHLPMLERPVEFNRAVSEFLRAVEAAPVQRARQASGGH